ncbi:MAG: 2Fe-2S iron-sulfur cluster binding domain-containing protein [Bacteroidetes bacterium]|nr:2Fe-2S iron-sulfur cluster binding domain-containing protein [Bacteroidota bacterium]
MPRIHYKGRTITCPEGANLRQVLIEHGLYPHNGGSKYLNCFGLGTCGTCAVVIRGEASEMNQTERIRLSVPPHRIENGLRLACQVRVLGEIWVEKGEGFWGQHLPESQSDEG